MTPLLLCAILGCRDEGRTAAIDVSDKMAEVDRARGSDAGATIEHPHLPGLHGGLIATLGEEEYHVELVVDEGGTIRLYTLASDETRVLEVDQQELTAYVKAAGGTESSVIVLRPEPQDGDAAGKSSQFTGALPESAQGQSLYIAIPNLRIAGERFSARFQVEPQVHSLLMPTGVSDDQARELYLTPGGKYTEADVEANGRLTAADKYRGFLARHDADPQPGDAICPVTKTKANPACTWIISGAVYQFCCPPCIDEFLLWAKVEPTRILPPEAYRKE